jgi:hypothetical protein
MIHSKPRIFFNITPVNPTGLTVVDLGEMDEGHEVARFSSLPPRSQKRSEHTPRQGRHQSLPPMTGTIGPSSSAVSTSTFKEVDDNAKIVGERESSPEMDNSQAQVRWPRLPYEAICPYLSLSWTRTLLKCQVHFELHT